MQTPISVPARAASAPSRALNTLDVEAVRVASERASAARIEQHPQYRLLASRVDFADAREVRRRLMAESLRLSDTMAPDAYRVARDAQRILGVAGELELYQRSGAENASIHLVSEPILLEIHGSLLSLLDADTLLGVFGHELGHYLAHGPASPLRGPLALTSLLGRVELDRPFEQELSRLSMLAELTADRIGLLACQDLHAMLRLEMVTLTGLSSGALTWDTEAYLAQSRDLMEAELAEGGGFYGKTHPEHNLRAYALWLFSETKTYQALTGRGPGTRELVHVESLLARFLDVDSDAQRPLVLDYSRLGEPPRELHECGLAAAVIVAHADEEVAEEELAAIEAVFATLVPDWRTYLDLDVALERFHETAPVLIAGGPDLLRTLFQLLVHVMGADGAVDVREVEMILAIGRALGVEDDYRRWLTSTLAALRVAISVEAVTCKDLPLPARSDDVASAFDTFLGGVVRRGESAITLRRLLRLLGVDRRTDLIADRIKAACRTRGIETTSDFRTVPLDQRIDLVAPATFRDGEAGERPAAVAPSRAGLMSALRRLREQLVSGDGRSPSVRLRKARHGRAFDLMDLERVSVGLSERVLTNVREGKIARVVDAADAGRHAGAAAAASGLLALVREHESRFEETGAHDLFLGYPFLTGLVGGYAVRAPLVLHPVDLERDGAGARGYRLRPRRDESPVVNQSLLRLVFNKKGFAFSDELADELDALAADLASGPEGVRDRLAEVGLATTALASALVVFADRDAELVGRGDFLEIEQAAVLGIFPQSNSDLLQDYDGLLQELAQPRANVATLLAAAAVMLPEGLVGPLPARAPATPAAELALGAPVILADPAQRSVIAECRRHGATVVDGPPGTGKSQVIVNLVAEALSRGERVAVVCEKRAALDVVARRLHVLGLEHAVAVVHDVQEDRKDLYAQIADRLDNVDARPFDAAAATTARQEHSELGGVIDARANALRARPDGLDLSVGELLSLVAGLEATPLPLRGELGRVPQSGLRALLDVAVSLHPLSALWGPQSAWRVPPGRAPRPSFAKLDARGMRDLETQLERTLEAARRYEALTAQTLYDPEVIEAARPAIEAARSTRDVRAVPSDRELFGFVLQRGAESPALLRCTDDAYAAWQESSAPMVRVGRSVQMSASVELQRSLSALRAWSGRWLRFFAIGWWLARSAFRKELAVAWPERSADPLTSKLLDDVADRMAASRAWQAVGGALDALSIRHLLPSSAAELEPFIGRIAHLGSAVRVVASARPALASAGAWPSTDVAAEQSLAQWDAALDDRASLLAARDALRSAAASLTATLPWVYGLPTSALLEPLLARFRADSSRLQEADALLERATKIVPSAQQCFDDLLAALPNDATPAWRSSLTKAWASAWLARLEYENVMLSRLGTRADDGSVDWSAARYAELEVDLRELEIERIISRIDDAELLRTEDAEKHQRRTAAQKLREELLKETRKKRRLMALRSFVRRYAPQGLLGVVPVWLLSPETMAILFPRQPLFDLVVFDEASQCTVESGFPVLLRAKRVVIAGDEKQMPPSSYFALGSGDEDDPNVVESPDAPETDAQAMKDVLSAESLLTLARTRVAHAPLTWHYRCRDEALIAFSNHAMYHGGLLTIPSTSGSAAKSALSWVHVPDGAYQSGENKPEAARVVGVVHELLRREKPPSIGVVTFNLKQRRAVFEAVDELSALDPDFGERWASAMSHDSMDERPFVKNLEQVQGDERDVIVFSLGHAPQERRRRGATTNERYVPARFGPLGQRGGERRLNVAISRAKSECIVVASFEPTQLEVKASRNEGPKLFKQFLEFAYLMHQGRRLEAERVLDLVRQSRLSPQVRKARLPIDGYVPLAAQIGLALEAEGIPHELDVGTSTFRVPVGILDPNDPTRFVLALLLDDGEGNASAYESHVHRRSVLDQRGWTVLHVNAAAWHRRRAELIEQIVTLVPGARGAASNDVYAAHRAAKRKPAAAPLASASSRVPNERAVAAVAAPPAAVPEWARAIEDPHFRKALLHLFTHLSLGESELNSLVGGPRRARLFARELETLSETLPFRVEVLEVAGAKIYRNVGAR